MKENVRYEVISPDGSHAIGYFLNNVYYSLPNNWVEGKVDSEGNYYSTVVRPGADNSKPYGKISNGILTKLSDGTQIQLKEIA